MAIEEKKDKDFEELYVKTIYVAKKNKEFKELEAITMEKDALEEKFKSKEMEHKHSKARDKVLQQKLAL